jgi:glycosyltransferase involved in cell wall biosynthesis
MTSSTEPGGAQESSEGQLGVGWRAAREAVQEQVLPSGQVVVSDALDRRGPAAMCMCGVALAHMSSSASPLCQELRVSTRRTPLRRLLRFAPAWANLRRSIAFDRYAASRLPDAEHLIAFNGQALEQFAAAKQARYHSISLLSANSHMKNVVSQHAKAHRQYPLERSWATRLVRRNVSEYERADRVYVASRYTWESFVEQGYPEERLSLFPFVPDPRFVSEEVPVEADTFDVVFSGRLTVDKGIPLLVDAVRNLAHKDLRLVLVGGWSSRGMRRFLQDAVAHDSRISIGPGDPLPRLRRARLCAHPTYEDGFAYAPLEAIASGVPALVSEDTGMKDLIDPGVNGLILPTGDLSALTDAIDAAYRGEIFA